MENSEDYQKILNFIKKLEKQKEILSKEEEILIKNKQEALSNPVHSINHIHQLIPQQSQTNLERMPKIDFTIYDNFVNGKYIRGNQIGIDSVSSFHFYFAKDFIFGMDLFFPWLCIAPDLVISLLFDWTIHPSTFIITLLFLTMSTTTSALEGDISQYIPKELFETSSLKAIRSLGVSLVSLILAITALIYFPWYLLPLGWIFLAFVGAGFFACGYACSQHKFFRKEWLNEIVGWSCMLPVLYSYEGWKRKNQNQTTLYQLWSKIVRSPFWLFGSIWDWVTSGIYFEADGVLILNQVTLYTFMMLLFSLLVYFVGLWGLFKFYIIPLVIYHFIMSTFLKANEETKDQNGVFCNFPKLIEFLTHHINHTYTIRVEWKQDSKKEKNKFLQEIQEAITAKIPQYNLRRAKAALYKKLGEKVKEIETSFTFGMISKFFKNHDLPLDNIDWPVAIFITVTPFIALYGILTTPFNLKTYILAFVFYYIGGIGITAGYHRLWSHRSYDAHWIVRFILLLFGSSTFQGSAINWSNDHRRHHRYTDTPDDPYDVTRSFWYAHMGWLYTKRAYGDDRSFVDHDLMKDRMLRIQDDYYLFFAFGLGWILPCLIAGYFWGDYRGGFLIAGVFKTVFLMQCTFFINSLAHYYGESTFDDAKSPKDSYLVSLLTFGEGYHNFHHCFPYDYRNGLHFWDYDPGKWIIWTLSKVGLTYNLKRFDRSLIEKGRIEMKQKALDREKKKYDWGKPKEELEEISLEEFKEKAKKQPLVIIEDVVYDVSKFMKDHPGGEAFIKVNLGKDVTKQFNGGVYFHSNAARRALNMLHIYRIKK